MNLDGIFRDFEARLAAQQQAEIEASARDEYRAEFQKIQMTDRLAAHLQEELVVRVLGSSKSWSGRLESVGFGWVQLNDVNQNFLIPTSKIGWWEGKSRFAFQESGEISRKLSFGFALRALVRQRLRVRILLGETLELAGRIERVGADFLELRLQPDDSVIGSAKDCLKVVPLNAISLVIV